MEPLVCRVRVMVLRACLGVSTRCLTCLGVDLSKPEWCFVRCLQFGQNLEELAHGVSPGHADILVLEYEEIAIPRASLFLPRSAQVQLGQCFLIGQMVALGLDDDYLIRPRRKKKRSFPFTPLGKLRKLGCHTVCSGFLGKQYNFPRKSQETNAPNKNTPGSRQRCFRSLVSGHTYLMVLLYEKRAYSQFFFEK